MDSPFFSIIIPTYNRQHLISRPINSILNQTFNDYEIIIVDDGSSDNTEQLVSSMQNKKIRYVKTENLGVAHARNTGIKLATGKYIGFLDSDDLLEKNHLESAYDFLKANNFPKVIHLNFIWGPIDRTITHKNSLPTNLPHDLFKSCSLHVNCLFIRHEIAKENLFNESKDLMFAEDWDFFIKLSVRYKILLQDKITAYLVDHEDRNMRNFDESRWLLRRNAIVSSLSNDPVCSKNYPNGIKRVQSHMNSLISVNLAARGNKHKSLVYFYECISQTPAELFTKRSMAVIKHLLFTWK